MRRLYVSTIRRLKRGFGATGLLGLAERSKNPRVRWLRSLLSIYDSADLATLDVPWWTYGAIDAVSKTIDRRTGQMRVLEYGSGASTIWLARRVAQVFTIEHDATFAAQMAPLFERYQNIQTLLRPSEELLPSSHARSRRRGWEQRSFDCYVNAVDELVGTFDIIVIDGRARVFCLEKSLPRLSAGGIIVFDNSDRGEYRDAIARSGLTEVALRGLAPSLPYRSQTSILEGSVS